MTTTATLVDLPPQAMATQTYTDNPYKGRSFNASHSFTIPDPKPGQVVHSHDDYRTHLRAADLYTPGLTMCGLRAFRIPVAQKRHPKVTCHNCRGKR